MHMKPAKENSVSGSAPPATTTSARPVLRISRAYAIATVEAVHAVENTVLGPRNPNSAVMRSRHTCKG